MNIHTQRLRAEIEGDFVVFLIGMRINKWWMIHKWLPVALGMLAMVKELKSKPELGLLGIIFSAKVSVQYWQSFKYLEAYGRSKEHAHLPAWTAFNKAIKNSNHAVGIWHETYLIKAGHYESLYNAMPEFGLGAAAKLVPASGKKETARGRLEN